MAYTVPIQGMPPLLGTSETFELSWELFGELCRVLALRVAREYEPDMVIGIATSGVMPAATIASILRADLYTMRISRRAHGERVREQPEVMTAAPYQARGKRVLVVDELTTTGDTLRLALAAVRDTGPAEIRTAASFMRPGGFRPDFHALETDALIVYPWDRQVLEDDMLVVNPIYANVIQS